ncbi:hypothetical protein M0804_006554 [Polistes exclamans]|nr:hypothetical protein M0804_006554 [Polistes exclamans]
MSYKSSSCSPMMKKCKNKYKISLDAQNLKPEDISITITGRKVTIIGKHKGERNKDGYEVKQFKRRYMFPETCNMDRVSSTLSTNGVLTITAPEMVYERIVNIDIIEKLESMEDDETEISDED